MSVIVFDIEATGMSPNQICQLSYLIVDAGKITGKNMYFTVDAMSPGAQAVHGLSLEMLEELSLGARFADRAQEIYRDFSRAAILVGHNVACDVRYLKGEFERLGLKLENAKTFCTMNHFTRDTALTRKMAAGGFKPPKLCELAGFFQLSEEFIARKSEAYFGGGAAAHDARFDATATYLCLAEGVRRGRVQGVL